jgi:sialidase-1
VEPICQASLLAVYGPDSQKHTLLFLNPAHDEKRENMTLRFSRDEGVSWPGSVVLHEGPSAYSDMTRLSNGNLACFYEAGNSNPYQGIVFQEIKWEKIDQTDF